jgi:hypothetical protein
VGRGRAQPNRLSRARRAAGAAVLAGALMAPGPAAEAKRPPIEGRVTSPYTVIALSEDGRARFERAHGRFAFVPPARTVTLHLVDGEGVYAGPVVAAGRGRRAVMRMRAGARLGTLRIRDGWIATGRRVAKRRQGRGAAARARAGVPIGAGVMGHVRSGAAGPGGPGRDRDRDGFPGRFDVDDDGDLVLDNREARSKRPQREGLAAVGGLAACFEPLCSGTAAVEVAGFDEVETALVIAIVAAALAFASLAWQIASALRRRRRSVEVEARLGLPVYAQRAARWAVFIEVHNKTDHPLRWMSAALEMRDGRVFYLMEHPAGGELPAVIQPHDSHHTWVDCHELEHQGLVLDQPVAASAKFATGEVYRSQARRLASRRSRLLQ